MKYCATCNTSYQDDSLQFCFEDGTPLSEGRKPAAAFEEAETVISKSPFTRPQVSVVGGSNSLLTFLLVAITTLLLGIFGFIIWIYSSGSGKKDTLPEVSRQSQDRVQNDVKSPTLPSANNSRDLAETPPTSNGDQAREVTERILSWKSMAESRDLTSYMNNYADPVNYYGKSNVSRDFVRKHAQRVFSTYDSIRIDIGDPHVTFNPESQIATAVFEKEYESIRAKKRISRTVKQQLKLKRIDRQWKIIDESNIKAY